MSEWIKVEDGMPPEDTDILICSFFEGEFNYCHVAQKGGIGWKVTFSQYSRHNSGYMVINFDDFEDGLFPITHWMPLPEPPEEL